MQLPSNLIREKRSKSKTRGIEITKPPKPQNLFIKVKTVNFLALFCQITNFKASFLMKKRIYQFLCSPIRRSQYMIFEEEEEENWIDEEWPEDEYE